MPLARAQRIRLARALTWSRTHGWVHDVYPNCWRSADGQAHVRFDSADDLLVLDRIRLDKDPLRCRVALVPVESPDAALGVLAALGYLPAALTYDAADEETRATYRSLMNDGRHAYISTYCQHDLHDDCKFSCKCCGAPCVCDRCLHTPPYTPTYIQPPLPGMPPVDEPDPFDGPASFTVAGQAFADWVDGRVTAERAAEVLSNLAHQGLIVSVAYHDESLDYAAGGDLMDHLEQILRETEQ